MIRYRFTCSCCPELSYIIMDVNDSHKSFWTFGSFRGFTRQLEAYLGLTATAIKKRARKGKCPKQVPVHSGTLKTRKKNAEKVSAELAQRFNSLKWDIGRYVPR